MFDDEKAEWDEFFDYFKQKFNEEVGLMPSVFENDDFEIDLVVGEDSGDILGVRVVQMLPYEDDGEEDDEEEADEEIDEIKTDEEDDEEDESDMVEIIQYDFVKKDITEAELEGKPYFQLEFGKPDEDEILDDEEIETDPNKVSEEEDQVDEDEGLSWFRLVIYSKPSDEDGNQELTGVVMINDKDSEDIIVFTEEVQKEE